MANKDVVPLPCDTIEMDSQSDEDQIGAIQESQEIWIPGAESNEKMSETVNETEWTNKPQLFE